MHRQRSWLALAGCYEFRSGCSRVSIFTALMRNTSTLAYGPVSHVRGISQKGSQWSVCDSRGVEVSCVSKAA